MLFISGCFIFVPVSHCIIISILFVFLYFRLSISQGCLSPVACVGNVASREEALREVLGDATGRAVLIVSYEVGDSVV